jgi:hypothetical protein
MLSGSASVAAIKEPSVALSCGRWDYSGF